MKRFLELSGREKAECVFCIVMTVLYVAFGIYSFFQPKMAPEKLLSIIIFMLGFLCFQDVLGKFYSMKNVETSVKSISDSLNAEQKTENIVEITTRQEFENNHPLEDRFRDATRICMFSHSNYAMFQPQYISNIVSGIRNGTSFQFLGFDPEKKDMIRKLKEYKMVSQRDDNPPLTSIQHYLSLKKDYGFTDNQIKFNVCDIDFPFGMTIVYKKSGETTVKVDFYTIKTEHMARRCIFLSSKNSGHSELISFFKSQWEEAWKTSKRSRMEERALKEQIEQ